jgi:hypothetical protein
MTAAGAKPLRRPPLVRDRVMRILRSAGFKTLIGTHLVVAAIILVRSYGCVSAPKRDPTHKLVQDVELFH